MGSASTVRPTNAIASQAMVPRTATASSSYTNMVNYEVTYWNKNNPGGPTFDGEDCTNFLSDALQAGGWSMVRKSTSAFSSDDPKRYMAYQPIVWTAGDLGACTATPGPLRKTGISLPVAVVVYRC
jgi:hypothetical protein